MASRILVCLLLPVAIANMECNLEGDLGNAGLSGPLIPELVPLANLQYVGLFGNNINGTIPTEMGNLTKLVSLDLYYNKLTGPLPASLGNLVSSWFMRLHRNKLTGTIASSVINLITTGRLRILDVSSNLLSGTVHRNNLTGFRITQVIQDPKAPAM